MTIWLPGNKGKDQKYNKEIWLNNRVLNRPHFPTFYQKIPVSNIILGKKAEIAIKYTLKIVSLNNWSNVSVSYPSWNDQ